MLPICRRFSWARRRTGMRRCRRLVQGGLVHRQTIQSLPRVAQEDPDPILVAGAGTAGEDYDSGGRCNKVLWVMRCVNCGIIMSHDNIIERWRYLQSHQDNKISVYRIIGKTPPSLVSRHQHQKMYSVLSHPGQAAQRPTVVADI